MTTQALRKAERIVRSRYARSERTRRDWVRYVFDMETIREIAKDREALY
jgi:hypothetical protein